MISYTMDKGIDIQQLAELFREAGWTDKLDSGRLEAMVAGSQLTASAWDGSRLVGFARCTTDHVFNGQINNVVVASAYRGQGIGRTLVKSIIDSNAKVTYILRPDPESVGFYEGLGFEMQSCMVYRRRE